MRVLDIGCNAIAYLRGEKLFRCRRCQRHYAIFERRSRVIPITREIADKLGKEDLVGKLEFVPFCTNCYPVTKCEF